MPGKHGDGAGRSRYVLVLREHDEQGSGYSLELAPLASTDAPLPLRARGGGSASNGSAAAVTATGTTPRGGSGEEAAGGVPSSLQALRSTRDTATAAGTGRRARGERDEAVVPASRPPLPRGSHARGLHTAAAGGPRGGDGESSGDGENGSHGGCNDLARDEGERILQEMRALIFPQPPSQPQESSNLDLAKNLKREREVLVPVFLSPKKKRKNSKDDIWNKRQIMYGIGLVGLLGFVPAIVAFLPQWALFVFAVVWGVSSIGFPFGLFGTSKLETGCSRHMGRFVFMGFCLVVIFMLYQYMALTGNSPQPAISPPPTESTPSSARVDTIWTGAFAFVGVVVMAGHMYSWARGCFTGSDNDDEESESSGADDMRSSDLWQRLLERH